jgi:hypothetical protein
MADENTGQTTPDAAVNNTGSADDKPSGTQTETTEVKPKTYSESEVNRIVQKRLKEAEDRQKKEREQADLTEAERLKAENAELRRAGQLRDAKEDVVAAARKAGMKATASADRLWRLIKDDVELDEKTGKVTNLKDLVATAKELDEDLFPKRPGGGDGGQGNGSPVGTSMNDMIRRSAGR